MKKLSILTALTLASVVSQAGNEKSNFYAIAHETVSWSVAKARAEEAGGYLACIETQEEMEYILSRRITRKTLWVGLTDEDSEGEWHWINGNPLDPKMLGWLETGGNLENRDFAHLMRGNGLLSRVVSGELTGGFKGSDKVEGYIIEWDHDAFLEKFPGDDTGSYAESIDVTNFIMPVEGETYHNELAGFTLTVPSNANLTADHKVEEIEEDSRKFSEENSSRYREAVKRGFKSKTLFRMHLDVPASKSTRFAPQIVAWQEELSRANQGVRPEQVLLNLRKAMQQATSIRYHDGFFAEKIGELTFTFQIAQIKSKVLDKEIHGIQEQHVLMLGDRLIGFSLTYNTVEEGHKLRDIIWSLKLDGS